MDTAATAALSLNVPTQPMIDGPLLGKPRNLLSVLRVSQFLSVGLLGAVVDTATILVLTTQFGIYRGAAKIVGAELAIVVMFLINEHWTFADEGAVGPKAFGKRLLKSNTVRLGGIAVATIVFIIVSGMPVALPIGGEPLWLAIANGIGIAAGFLVNYTAESLFTWRVGRPPNREL